MALLLSGGEFDSSHLSFLGLYPFKNVSYRKNVLTLQTGAKTIQIPSIDPWSDSQNHFFEQLEKEQFAFGWFSYEMGSDVSGATSSFEKEQHFPDAYWQVFAIFLCYDQEKEIATATIDRSCFEGFSDKEQQEIEQFNSEDYWKALACYEELQPLKYLFEALYEGDKKSYIQKVEEIQEKIREGTVYQVNLAHSFNFLSNADPFFLFSEIYSKNETPFAAYFNTQEGSVLSFSPERFLCRRGNYLETRPIKGTAPRGLSAAEDEEQLRLLLASEKEGAELLMITDLMRNDLGKVSEPGSVKVRELKRSEKYENVFHLLSVIESVSKDLPSLEIVRSCFPAGSITGCPKKKAIEIISVLEGEPRGIYTGAIGYFKGCGDFDLSVAIRTAIFDKTRYLLKLGSGITIDSDPESEYLETLHKGASFFKLASPKGEK